MTTTLAANLNMAKSRRMQFLLVAKGTDTTRLLLSPSKVKGEEVKAAMTATSGKVVARGQCYRDGRLMIFECIAKPPTTLSKLLMKSIKTEAKMSLLVQARHVNEVASEQEQLARNKAKFNDRIRQISAMMKDLKPKVAGEDWQEWHEARTASLKTAAQGQWDQVFRDLDELEQVLDHAGLETDEAEEATERMQKRQEAAVKEMTELEGRIKPPVWKNLQKLNQTLTKAIEQQDWQKATQRLAELVSATKSAKAEAEAPDSLDSSGDAMRKLFPDKEEQEEADLQERDRWMKQIRALAERADKLTSPEGTRLRNRVAGLFQMLKSKEWDDVKASVNDAAKLLTAAEKAEVADNEKQRAKFTKAIKELGQRARKLKDAKGNDLGKSVVPLSTLLTKQDWTALEKQLAEVEKAVDEAENRLSDEDAERIKLTNEIKQLATRAAKLTGPDDVPVRNRVAGLFQLVQAKDWDGLREDLAEATELVVAAEKRKTTPTR